MADGVRIRKLNVQGTVATVTTFVGSTNGYQDGIGTAAKFKSITSMTIDGNGNLFVTDASDYRIRKITPLGVVSTLAGNGSYGYVNNTGTTAQFQSLAAIMFDKVSNTLLVADGASIRKVVPSTQMVSTPIGASGNVSEYVNGSFADARFGNQISSIVAGPLGDFFVMDRVNNRIRRLVLQDDRAYSFMGSGLAGFSDGIPTDVKFNSPYALFFDEQGNLFVSDSYNNIIRKVSIK